MLSQYRVLDLADEKGVFCGKLLGDLGADVIKIEKPGGDTARRLGPFFHDEPHPEKSLFWFAFNTSKRGVTLNLESVDGREIFKRLVKTADVIVESFNPGYLNKIGLDYTELEKINPGIIVVSITPFGQTGPYRDYKAPDIVAWAMGGQMAPFGEIDRPPIRIGYHSQAYLNAAADAASGALLALYSRWNSGEGQHIDVSIQDSVVNCTEHITSRWDLIKFLQNRVDGPGTPGLRVTRIWPCKDGYISWFYWEGVMSIPTNVPLVKWMENEGMADEFILKFDWSKFGPGTAREDIDRIEATTSKFFLSHTKAELFEGAIQRNVQVYPVSTAPDMLDDPHLSSRKFWVEVDHPELDTSITYPGAFACTSEAPPRISRRAPLIGEHNQEIFEKELGMPHDQLALLKQAGVI